MDLAATAAEFTRGGLAGLVVCVPPGPVGTLCVTRSVRHGFLGGFSLAAGSAMGDATYVAIAAFGVASLSERVGAAPRIVAFVAAPLLLWVGVRMLVRARAAVDAIRRGASSAPDEGPPPSPARSAAAGYAMALGTPGTLPALLAVLAAFGPSSSGGGLVPAVATSVGALAAALVWWTSVALLACRFRGIATRYLHVIDAAGGACLVLASFAALHVAVFGAGLPTL